MPNDGFVPKISLTNAITAALTRIVCARGFLEATTGPEEWVRQMDERVLVLERHHTTHVKGRN